MFSKTRITMTSNMDTDSDQSDQNDAQNEH